MIAIWTEPWDGYWGNSQDMDEWGSSRQGGKWVALIVIGLLLIMMAIMGAILMAAMSDFARDFAGGMTMLPAVEACVGVILIAIGIITRRKEMEEKIRREAVIAQQIERQRQMIELDRLKLVDAVKATIRVRCRYCGTLNEENEEKCDSCGASL